MKFNEDIRNDDKMMEKTRGRTYKVTVISEASCHNNQTRYKINAKTHALKRQIFKLSNLHIYEYK